MAKNLLIVESPAKAKTINKYLGKDFTVLASYGHVRDLVPKEGAVDPDHGFAMRYDLIEKNEKHVEAIAKAAKSADALYLATDPDREGEAISWHIAEILRERGLLEGKTLQRVVFTEITPRAIKEAMTQPRADRHRPGRRAAGAPRARLPGRLQPVAGAVAQGPARPVRRPRAVAGAAHDRRARGGDRSLRRPRVLVDRGRVRAPDPDLHRQAQQARRQEVRAVHRHRRRHRRGRAPAHRRGRQRRAARHRRRQQGAQAPPVAAVHHLDAAAGRPRASSASPPPHHARRAEAVRRRGDRRRGHGRPDQLHAYRLGQPVGRSAERDPRRDRARLRHAARCRTSPTSTRPSPRTRRKRTKRSARPRRCARRRRCRASSATTSAACTN